VAWQEHLRGDPLEWLLSGEDPAVRAAALQCLLDRPSDDPDVVAARAAALDANPIRAILDAQRPDGAWVKPGPGYSPKYSATVWQVTFLDQLGADAADSRVRRACEYVLDFTQTSSGGFGAFGGGARSTRPAPSLAIHCLHGNLLRALIGFGYLDDPRVQAAIAWAAAAITGEGAITYYRSGTSGPGFACGANERRPCAWGAVKQVLALARIPAADRGPAVARAIEVGAAFLLSTDPAEAAYPWPSYSSGPSRSWFKLGFPSGYVTDVLQNLEALTAAGRARDPRLAHAVAWLESRQDADGRWKNQYAYNGKTTVDFERQGQPSRWVTLRACTVLRAVHG
jgi:hypothetical protein